MKKFVNFLGLLVIVNVLFISSVYASTEEDELNAVLNLIPDEYNLSLSSSVELTEMQKRYYLFSKMSDILDNTEYDFSLCTGSSCITGSPYMAFIDIDGDNYKITLSKYYNDDNGEYGYSSSRDESYSVSKQITFNFNYVDVSVENEEKVNDAITYINNKSTQFSDFNLGGLSYNFITSPQILDEVEEIYEVEFINYAYAGSGLPTYDEQLEVSFHKDCIYVFKDNVLYQVFDEVIMIDTTITYEGNYTNNYYPKLSLSDYTDIDDYIDDVFEAFKERTGITNALIKEMDNGDRYKITSSSDDTDYYQVVVVNLDDNTEWTICFSGKLKEESSVLLGDMNGNGKIDFADVMILLRMYLRIN